MIRSRLPFMLAVAACALLALAGATAARAPRPSAAQHAAAPRFDTLILHGHIIDGTGSPWYSADIGIRNGRIAAIGNLSTAIARRVIDATGLTVSPGFFDMLSHSEVQLIADAGGWSKVYEGVTTEAMGETAAVACAGPATGIAFERQKRLWGMHGVNFDWTTIDGFLRRLQRGGIRLNALTYANFGAIRESVLGDSDRAPTPAELDREKSIMRQAMEDGAFGLADGLLYTPDIYASTREIAAVAQVAGRAGGIYCSHIRNLEDPKDSGTAEAIAIGRLAHIPVQEYHLQVGLEEGPDAATNVLRMMQQARDEGVDISANAYPYTAAANPLSSMVAPRDLVGGDAALAARLRDPAQRPRIVAEIAATARALGTPDDPDGWKEEYISTVSDPADVKYVGKTMYEVGLMDGVTPAESVANILIREHGGAGRMFFNKTEATVRQILLTPWVSIGSDGIGLDSARRSPNEAPHPRNFGTQATILGPWVRHGIFTLPEAIRKMTALPAQTLRIPDRGLLKPGFWADVNVFDPAKVRVLSTYRDPWHYSEGMVDVLVNGVPVLSDGRPTSALPGQALRGPGWVGRRKPRT
jgi:N-acyl-D-amino-acid deacylase